MDIARLSAGHQLPEVCFVLDREDVRAYRDAVADASPLYEEDASLVPPTAVAALSLRHMLGALSLPPGTVHVGQELSFRRPVTVGQELVCRARIAQTGQRKEWLTMVVEFQVDTHPQGAAVAGRSTLFIKLEGPP